MKAFRSFYIASRFENQARCRLLAESLIAAGYNVTSHWLYKQPDGAGVYAGNPALWQSQDLADVDRADALIHVTARREDGYTSGGNHTEFGYALSKGKPILAVGPRESVFHYNVGVQQFVDEAALLAHLSLDLPILVGICGEAEAGKDTLAQQLVRRYAYERHALADALKEDMVPLLYGPHMPLADGVARINWEKLTSAPIRSLLQAYGVAKRGQTGDYWIQRLFLRFAPWQITVVPDVRFSNEIERIQQGQPTLVGAGRGVIVRVDRPGHENALSPEQRQHQSEQEWRSFTDWDAVIVNGSTPEAMLEQFDQQVLGLAVPSVARVV